MVVSSVYVFLLNSILSLFIWAYHLILSGKASPKLESCFYWSSHNEAIIPPAGLRGMCGVSGVQQSVHLCTDLLIDPANRPVHSCQAKTGSYTHAPLEFQNQQNVLLLRKSSSAKAEKMNMKEKHRSERLLGKGTD